MANEDLLLRLFKSEFFDEFLALRYLYKKTGGAHEYLCNRLFQMPEDALDQILSPLCDLAVRSSGPDPALQRTLVGLAQRSMKLAVKIYWILQSIIDESRSTPRASTVRSLLDACKESAVTTSVDRAASEDSRSYDLGERMWDSCQEDHVDMPSHVDESRPESLLERARNTGRFSRLQYLQNELGQGEGVSALVQASLQDLDAGGDGVVAAVAGGVPETHQAFEVLKKPMHHFQATVHFFDALCNCGRGLVNLAKERRHSLLRQRLETCNALLFTDAMMCQVLWPMSTHNECVLRLVPDQMTVLNSRERTPFLLFVETVEYVSQSQAVGTVKRIVDNAEHLQPDAGLCVPYTSLRFNTPPSEPGAGSGPEIMYSHCGENSQGHKCLSSDVTDSGITCASIVNCPCRNRVPSVRSLASQGRQGTASIRLPKDQGQHQTHVCPSFHTGDRGVGHIVTAQIMSKADDSVEGDWVHVPEAHGLGTAYSKGSDSHDNPYADGDVNRFGNTEVLSRDEYIQCVHGDSYTEIMHQIRSISPFGRLHGWNCHAVIVKSEDDCRQELLAMQLIHAFQRAFDSESLPLWLKPYQVIPISQRSALIEVLPDAVSIHSIKKNMKPGRTLADHFFRLFPLGSPECEAAQRAFAQSLAAYSIICYLLQVKDRHNANILLDKDGHIIHIDFGFMLSNSPGGVSFERAPFKLTAEYMMILGSDVHSTPSPSLQYFQNMWCAGYAAAAKHSESIIELIEIMQDSELPCFASGRKTADNVKKRFKIGPEQVLSLLLASVDAWTTRQYDYYQRILNGIM